ncbi:alpha/beta fold hydrolase [Aestuariicoccus sp. MJ-SS9]|uniref:alpha/beta fold hydrolase n=1 Tax=Aestuariicoccus sp. MJ-SS9 TaxID=3079855 RepID=UPI00290D208F|nr:alpha/beta fold hydrolase [Aestuariicoccus sp. MJ-SS9]MDU8913883.1 alpha/beta fold hydrolase [Aestuariicoccus sp. MJ-SS9]
MNILLVHGSAHGAWCWRKLLPQLTARGHKARAIDLPSHGDDPTPLTDVTLDRYAQAILDALDGPTMVVGHSMGGYPISRAAEMDPSRIAHLVYLCAYVPWPGMGLVDMRKRAPRQPLMKAVRLAEDGQSFTIDPAHAREVFYHDCSDADVAFAIDHLCPQAVLPQATPVELGANWESVPRSYVICAEDGAIPSEFQHTMAADFPPERVHEMPTSHSPFLSDPEGLADLIDHIATEAAA